MKSIINLICALLILATSSQVALSQGFISPVFTFDTKAPVAILLSPNGGEAVNNTAPLQVTWNAMDDNLKPNPITIQLIVHPGNNVYTLAQNLPNTGTASVNLPDVLTDQAKIKVSAKDMFGNEGADESDANFTINGTLSWITVQGFVKDITTGLGLAGVTLNLIGQTENYTVISQSNGSFTFGSVRSGYYNLSAFKNGYQSYNEYVLINVSPVQTININLSPGSSNSLTINPSLTAYADNITESPADFFTLNGNVSINNVLYFSGQVKIDKRSYLVKPEINGSGSIFSKNIPGHSGDFIWKNSSVSYAYKFNDNNLEPKSYAGIIDGTPSMGGFNLTLGQFVIDPEGDHVECKVIVGIPYPIEDIFGEVEDENPEDVPAYINEVASSIIVSKTEGLDMSADVSISNINLGLVNIEEMTLYFNTAEQVYGGSISMVIPGIPEDPNLQPDNVVKACENLEKLPVEVRDENGKTISETSFGNFVQMQDAFGLSFLKIGFEIEFVQGAINKLIVTLGAKIPIGQTGLFITEMTGGVEDLASEDWKVLANVDIETGLEIPGLGNPIKFNDFGVLIHPWSYFKGSGSFVLFEEPVSDGYIEYDHSLSSLKAECSLDLYGILKGEQIMNLQGGLLSGSAMLSVQTPDDLPWYLSWAENIVVGSAYTELHNYTFQSVVDLPLISLAQRLTYWKNSFPFIHYELGRNLKHLHQIWKGQREAKQSIIFQVPENSSSIMVVAMDSINPQLFDFTLINPSGKIFNSSNTSYQQYPDAKQTVMLVDMPVDGDWLFLTEYTGNVALFTSATDHKPSGIVSQPETRGNRSNQISLTYNDYADTLQVQVFYDTDHKNFDGSFIDNFSLVNNANLTFDWQNESIPDGEYFIYSRIDDGKNAPALQYAPGSILVQNNPGIETPQNLIAVKQGDSVIVSWTAPVQTNILAATVYYKDKSTQRTEEESVSNAAKITLKGLAPGRGYEIWCRFMNDADAYSPKSNVEEFVFTSGARNNPPYFTMNRDSAFIFVAGTGATYTLLASDADGNALTFTLPGDTLGIAITGNQLIWTPSLAQRGVYRLKVVVSDGSATDTTWQKLVVYTPEQTEILLSFSSVRLYEEDNMFVILRNFYCHANEQSVTLTNIRSGQQTEVSCRRVNDFEFIGQFELSFAKRTAINVENGDSLRASYTWDGQVYKTYAYYDSLPQPSDQTPPGAIDDLVVERLSGNQLKLVWTATGNDGDIGKAYRYDIRYAYVPVNSEDIYFTSLLIGNPPYPSMSGSRDSLIINLSDLEQSSLSDSVYFSIKAEDEMLNRGGLSNSPGGLCLLNPANITAHVMDMVNIKLDWDGPIPTMPPTGGILCYNLYRSINSGALLPYRTGIVQTTFTDSLTDFPDGIYQYAIQAIYEAGSSDTVFATAVDLQRFVNVNMLLTLGGATNFEGIALQMTALDTIYAQTFNRTTGSTGLLLLGNVFKSSYVVEVSKAGYIAFTDTINVIDNPSMFNIILLRNIPSAITLQNIAIQSSQDTCFEATQTITVAGNGTEFSILDGGIATMVAGQNIILLPVSKVYSSGYLHAYITTNDQYCSSLKNNLVASGNDETIKDENHATSVGSFFKIYPNPTEGRFALEFTHNLDFPMSKVHVYNLYGVEVLKEEIKTNQISEFSLRNQTSGIYIIRVVNGNQSETSKMIKL